MPQLYNDTRIKLEYNSVVNKKSLITNGIGPDCVIVLDEYPTQTTDAIYVNAILGDDVNIGTYASPKETIVAAITACDATHSRVIIYGNDDYKGELGTITNLFFQGLYKLTGNSPRVTTRDNGVVSTDLNTIYVSKTGNDSTGTGTKANPVLTITKAATLCTSTKTIVLINDSGTYYNPLIVMEGYFQSLFSDEFESPTIVDYEVGTDIELFDKANVIAPDIASTGNLRKSIALMPNNDVVMVKGVSTTDVRYTIYDSAYGVVKAETSLSLAAGSHATPTMVALNDTDVFIVIYVRVTTDYSIRFKVLNVYTNTDVTPWTLYSFANNGPVRWVPIDLKNGNICINYVGYDISGTSYFSNRFMIVNYTTGAIVKAPTQIDLMSYNGNNSSCLFNDDNAIGQCKVGNELIFMYGYYEVGGTINVANTTKWAKYDLSGNVILAAEVFSTTFYDNVKCIDYGNYVLMSEAQATPTIRSIFHIFDPSTKEILYSSPDQTAYTMRRMCNNIRDNSEICICDVVDDAFIATVGTSKLWALFKVNILSKVYPLSISGIKIDSNNENTNTSIHTVGSVNIKNISVMNDYSLTLPHAVACDISKSIANGTLRTQSNDVSITDSIFTKCLTPAIYITGAATASGDITIEHCDVINNYAGIRLVGNNGTNEVIKNNIIKGNGAYGINADTQVTETYCVNTDVNTKVTVGTGCIASNPLYINEGAISIDDLDLRLKSKLLGYPVTSPATGRSDDNRNCGSYNEIIIGDQTAYTSNYVTKPEIIPVSKAFAGAVNVLLNDGSYDSYKAGQTEIVELRWKGITNIEFDAIDAIMCSSDKNVRVYFEPDTNPNVYYVYTILRNEWASSASHVIFDQYGKSDISIKLARKYER